MKINEYINSGILEAYLFGGVTEEESAEFLKFKEEYPEVKAAYAELEDTIEMLGQGMSIPPPAGMLSRIDSNIKALVIQEPEPFIIQIPDKKPVVTKADPGEFIKNKETVPVEIDPPLIPLGKSLFFYIAILGIVFLAIALTIYFKHQKDQEHLEQIKTELKKLKTN